LSAFQTVNGRQNHPAVGKTVALWRCGRGLRQRTHPSGGEGRCGRQMPGGPGLI